MRSIPFWKGWILLPVFLLQIGLQGAVTVTELSDPTGIVATQESLETGTVRTLVAPEVEGEYSFGYWESNGNRMATADGTIREIVEVIIGAVNVTYTARYFKTTDDTDGDGLPDWYEQRISGNLAMTADGDPDGDGFSNLLEYQRNLNPMKADQNIEGGTSIRNSNALSFADKSLGLYLDESTDDDNDSLPDRYEIKQFGNLSENAGGDTDGDGFSNLLEYQRGMEANRSEEVTMGGTSVRNSNVLNFTDRSLGLWLGEDTDDDNDSIPDLYELKQFDRFDYGANDDTDGDGFSNLREYRLGMEANRSEEITSGGTSIRNSNILRFSDKTLGLYLDESIDDDNDSLPDRYEIKNFGSLSESATEDFDGDGFSNLREYQLGMEANRSEELVPGGTSIRNSNLLTLQLLTDTDGDGLPDSVETNTGIYVSSTDTGTDANKSDTDGDGFSDSWELNFGSDPFSPSSLVNSAPTDLNTTHILSILENLPDGEFVAEFNATDSDTDPILSYSLVDGNGSSGNAFFSIDANGTLRTATVLDYESNPSHTVRVRVSDQHNYFLDKVFTVQVQDMDEGTAPALGDGSEENPYQIDTLAHLKWLSFTESVWNQNKHFIQTRDINASDTKNWANGYGFSPIGTYSLSKDIRFKGIYDGNGYRIFNLFINRNQQKYVGLFGISLQSYIKNIHLINSSITGESRVGGLVGFMGETLMENSSFDGNVSGQEYVGGLSGFTQTNTNITKSFSSGKVIGISERIGGLVGINATHSKIIDCYSKSETSGTKWIGGLVGLNETNAKIIRSYSLGLIANIQEGDQSGGLVGANENNATISASFWDVNSSGQSTSAGTGAVGKSTAEMKTPSTFLNAGWDFNQTGGTWKMTAGQTYPRLTWETLPNTPPSDLNATAPLQVLENQPAGTLVGQFTAYDPDIPSTLSYRIDNAYLDKYSLRLDTNGTLWTKAPLDFEANATLTIRVKVEDQHGAWIKKYFTIEVLNKVEDFDGDGIEDAHDPDDDNDGYSDIAEIAYGSDPRDANSTADTLPTDMTLSSLEIMENQPIGTIVGQFTVLDPDPKDTHVVRFKDTGASVNHLFTIDANNTLRTAAIFDFEHNASTLNIRVRAKQNQTTVLWKFFALSLINDPSDDALPPVDQNTTQPPVLDGNLTDDPNTTLPPVTDENQTLVDHNTTQPPILDGNDTHDHNVTLPPIVDGNDTLVDQNDTLVEPPIIEPVTPKYVPIVRTQEVVINDQGTFVFRGRILTDGGSDILEAGIEISQSLRFRESKRHLAQLNGNNFQVKLDDLEPGARYYYRAFAKNEVGESPGARKRLKIPALPPPTAWWAKMRDAENGWTESAWFGAFQKFEETEWIYHTQLGWIYAPAESKDGIWLWMEPEGWLWTNRQAWSYLWKHDSGSWLYFQGNYQNGRPIFFDYASETWR